MLLGRLGKTMKPNFTAILVGTAVYLLLIVIHHWVLFSGIRSALFDSPSAWDYISPLYVAVNAVVPGYVAGRVAKQSGLIHAGIVAILGAIIAPFVTDLYIGSNSHWMAIYWGLTQYGVLCTVSGLLGEYHAQKRRVG